MKTPGRLRRLPRAIARRALGMLRAGNRSRRHDGIDFAAPDVARDPFPFYEQLRARGAVHYVASHSVWVVLGYDEVQSALLRPALFSNAAYDDVDRVLLAADPPDHAAMRRLVMPYFTAEAIDRLASIAELRAAVLLRQGMDVVSGYGIPISEAVATSLVGLPEEAVEEIRALQREASDLSRFTTALGVIVSRASIYSRFIADGLPDADARSLVGLLWLASTTTTERAIAHCVYRILLHPELRTEVSGNRELLAAFVEEVLRLHPPELMLPRVAREAVELGGVVIPAGSRVLLCVAAANRDPARFERPSEIVLTRRGSKHFTFGSGIHHCIGASLGRRVIEIAVATLLDRAPGFQAVEPLEGLVSWCSMTASPIGRLLLDLGHEGEPK